MYRSGSLALCLPQGQLNPIVQMSRDVFQYVLLIATYIPVAILFLYILTVVKVRMDIRCGERQRRELGAAQEPSHHAKVEVRLVVQVSQRFCVFRSVCLERPY